MLRGMGGPRQEVRGVPYRTAREGRGIRLRPGRPMDVVPEPDESLGNRTPAGEGEGRRDGRPVSVTVADDLDGYVGRDLHQEGRRAAVERVGDLVEDLPEGGGRAADQRGRIRPNPVRPPRHRSFLID